MDAPNKQENDIYDPAFVVEGVTIPGLTFVDDTLEAIRNVEDLEVSIITNECFEKTNRVSYKPTKCKLMFKNCEEVDVCLNGVKMDSVDAHDYLGTIVEKNGRKAEVESRVSQSMGVLNEIVELSKTEGVSVVRLRFVRILINSCFKMKIKYGCEVWDGINKKTAKILNDLIPNTLKRIMELPGSTPTCAVKHDFGICNLDSEVDLERIILAQNVVDMDDERIVKRLLIPMFEKQIKGFCTVLKAALEIFEVKLGDGNINRDELKKKLCELQKKKLFVEMLKISKCSNLVINYDFDGKMKDYLLQLPFREARMIFMLRSRMFPTKVNFQDRWGESLICQYCCNVESDEHLFQCCGYLDITNGVEVSHGMFMKLEATMEQLSDGANVLKKMHDRLVILHGDKDINI